MTFDQSKIVPEAAKQVAGVYYAVEKKDAALYKSLLCNEYLAYTEQYWQQTGYTYDMLLSACTARRRIWWGATTRSQRWTSPR